MLIRPAAAADIEDAFLWYEAQRPGLGEEFRESLRDSLSRIAENPRFYQVLHRNTRRILLERFPYAVYYREFPELIVVVACMHGRRDPKRWRSRR